MRDIAHENMTSHSDKISGLRQKFEQICRNSNDEEVAKMLKEMRIIHGCAIYDNETDVDKIKQKGVSNTKDEDWIRLSTNASFIDVIHHHIKFCEKLAFSCKKANAGQKVFPNSDELKGNQTLQGTAMYQTNPLQSPTQPQTSKVVPIMNRVSPNTEELVLQNIQTDNGPSTKTFNFNDLFEVSDASKPQPQKGGRKSGQRQNVIEVDTTEYINNINTSEAARLSEIFKPKQMDLTKPTLVNYWADWCSYSQKFLPKWEELVPAAKKEIPDLVAKDFNVRRDPELIAVAKQAGVRGYPTLMLYYNDKRYEIARSGDVNEMIRSIKSHIAK